MIPLVDLQAQYASIKHEIDRAISRVLESASFIQGQELENFEHSFAQYQQTAYAVGVANGTSALFFVLRALEIGPDDEVITTPHTFMASIEPIVMVGARPVFVDIDPFGFTIDPARIEKAITPRTKAIIPVHLYGQMADMDQVMKIAQAHKLFVIEDACQAHGASFSGRHAGAWGNAACFSFFPSKNLGAYGDGGAVCTNDRALAERVKSLRDHGRDEKFVHKEFGYNGRLDALQAAILSAKLPYLDEWNDARRKRANYYNKRLANTSGVSCPLEVEGAYHVYHLYCVRLSRNRDEIRADLNRFNIGTGIHYPIPAHLQPAMQGYGLKKGDFPITEAAASSVLSLPLYPELDKHKMDFVVEKMSELIDAYTSVE